MTVKSGVRHLVLSGTCLLLPAFAAQAFDPNAGAEPSIRPLPATRAPAPLPPSIVPARYYTTPEGAAPLANAPAPSAAPQPAVIAPPQISAVPPPAPATIAPLPEIRAIPAEQPAFNAVPVATPAYDYSAPIVAPAIAAQAPVAAIAPAIGGFRANRFNLSVEGYYDDYREDVVDLKDQGYFGSVGVGYEHYFTPAWYGGIDWRGSIGSTDYESISGTADNIRQWETEGRVLVGYDQDYGQDQHAKVYIGGGVRYFYDEFKGVTTSLGASGYDRRILQFYVPIGVTYEFRAYGYQFAPTLEYDQFLYGYVNSRLQSIPGFDALNNHQHRGYGIRGEFLVGQTDSLGRGWQFGPFIRWWDIKNSDIDTTPSFTGLEPANTRFQVGAKLKWLF